MAEGGCDHELLLDLTEEGLFMPTDKFSLMLVSPSLLILVSVDEARAADLLLRHPAIFRKPLLSGEFLFFSASDSNEGGSESVGDRSHKFDDCVVVRCSLEEHKVGAVDCDWVQPWYMESDATLTVEMEEGMPSISAAGGTGSKPRFCASNVTWSSRSSSEVVEVN